MADRFTFTFTSDSIPAEHLNSVGLLLDRIDQAEDAYFSGDAAYVHISDAADLDRDCWSQLEEVTAFLATINVGWIGVADSPYGEYAPEWWDEGGNTGLWLHGLESKALPIDPVRPASLEQAVAVMKELEEYITRKSTKENPA